MIPFSHSLSTIAARLCARAVQFAAVLVMSGCGGGGAGDAPPAAGDVGTGSIPAYVGGTEILTLPLLQMGDKLQADVKVRLGKDYSWTLLSGGALRDRAASESASASLAVASGKADLTQPLTDATLTIKRLHVGKRVFANVRITLAGNRWSFLDQLQEVKALRMDDFASNKAIRADESHHVALSSHPASGVQRVPMQLATRSYRFCMDAQAEGADSSTLVDPGGRQLFVLKAGEPCVTIKAQEGKYSFEHRYGGTGSMRTVFLRKQNDAKKAASPPVLQSRSAAPVQLKSLTPLKANLAGPNDNNDDEYWQVRNPSYFPNTEYSDLSGQFVYSYMGIGDSQTPCTGDLHFGLTLGGLGSLFKVNKDPFGTPVSLGEKLGCPNASAIGYGIPYTVSTFCFGHWPQERCSSTGSSDRSAVAYNSGFLQDPRTIHPIQLAINNLSGNRFEVLSQTDLTNESPFGLWGLGLLPGDDGKLLGSLPGVAAGSLTVLSSRYFPNGLPFGFRFEAGEVALFKGTYCTGSVVVTSDDRIAGQIGIDINDYPYRPVYETYKSIRLGGATQATFFSIDDYLRNDVRRESFKQIICTNSDALFGDLVVTVETVDMVISTNECEACNLSGLNFSGHNLVGARLSNADLAGAILTKVDLSGADLRAANLQGADLSYANLDGANLCNAFLNPSPLGGGPTQLPGAHLRDTNLAGADLSSANFSFASFYSSGSPTVQTKCDTYVASGSASATNATISNTSFESAYMANVDMSAAKGQGVVFTNAALFGVSFVGATLTQSGSSAVGADFQNARMQGSNFTNADVSYANFTGAQLDTSANCIQAIVTSDYTKFPGFKITASDGKTCVASTQTPSTDFCVAPMFTKSPGLPRTNCTNRCADGIKSAQVPTDASCTDPKNSCSVESWNPLNTGSSRLAFRTGSCDAKGSPPPVCTGEGPFGGGNLNTCW